LAVLAALFHDLGKSSNAFQNKLKGHQKPDAIRHEWVSILILSKFINGRGNEAWLDDLSNGNLEEKFNLNYQNIDTPLEKLPDSAKMVAWLVFTHHLLPIDKDAIRSKLWIEQSYNFKETMSLFNEKWGYANNNQEQLKECFNFKELPSKSLKWQVQVKKWSRKLKECLPPKICSSKYCFKIPFSVLAYKVISL
jgi:CRISPR-associated endonuclease/helicase Cas3